MRKLWISILIVFVFTPAIARETRLELRSWINGRWAVVEVREVVGALMIVHPADRRVVRKTISGGIKYAFIGGLTGLMAGGFYEDGTAKEEMLFGLKVGGAVGCAFGFLDGLLSVEMGRTANLSSGFAPKAARA